MAQNGAKLSSGHIPDLPKRLFWDWRYDAIDWQNAYQSIIARVLERGNKDEWKILVNFYGEDKIIHALKSEIKYFPDYDIDDICKYFKLNYEQLACYAHKQERRGHWI